MPAKCYHKYITVYRGWNARVPQVMLELDQLLLNKLLWKWPLYRATQYHGNSDLRAAADGSDGCPAASCRYTQFLEASPGISNMVVVFQRISPPESSKSTGPQPWPGKEATSRSTRKSENEKYNRGVVQWQEPVSAGPHSSCSLDTVFVSWNSFKQLNTTESLNPLLDFF